MRLLGVDPGSAAGGWALLAVEGDRAQLLASGSFTGWQAVADWRALLPIEAAVIEDVHVAPKQGLVSAGKLMWAKGCAEGGLQGLGVPGVVLIPPARWKASMGLPGGLGGKAVAMMLAQRLLGVTLVEHQAEAALLAWAAYKLGLVPCGNP